MPNDEEPDMNAESTHFPLARMDYGCGEGSAFSFTTGALIATTVCAIGYLIYNYLACVRPADRPEIAREFEQVQPRALMSRGITGS
jgi:hypothetical protein